MASQFPAAPPVITDDGDTSWLAPQQFPAAPPQQGSGYWLPSIIGGILNAAKSGATLPGDVATGKASMADPATQQRVGDMAGLVTLGAGALPAEENALNMGIKAYHGSPHSFDQFDMSKIGTGEGAQAYGHGLYFADSEGVAKQYRDQLSRNVGNTQTAAGAADRAMSLANGDRDAALANIDGQISAMNKSIAAMQAKGMDVPDAFSSRIANEYQPARDLIQNGYKTGGHLYQVDINADPEHFLDWDKPLSEQPKAVQDAYNARVSPNLTTREIGNNPTLGPLVDVIHPSGGTIGTFTKDRLPDVLSNPAKYVPTKGQDFYNDLARQSVNGDWGSPGDFAQNLASNQLREAGIPGIKYLDQGSRAKGDGSRNYVVFNDALVKVLKKYGLAGMGGAAGAGAMMNQPQPAQAGQFPQAPAY